MDHYLYPYCYTNRQFFFRIQLFERCWNIQDHPAFCGHLQHSILYTRKKYGYRNDRDIMHVERKKEHYSL